MICNFIFVFLNQQRVPIKSAIQKYRHLGTFSKHNLLTHTADTDFVSYYFQCVSDYLSLFVHV